MSNYNRGQQHPPRSRGRSSRGQGRGSWTPFKPLDTLDRLNTQPLMTVPLPVPAEDAENVNIRGCRYLGSYSWLNEIKPTILVPGSPPQWIDRPFPYQVKPDVGLRLADQGSYRLPSSILWPLIASVNKLNGGNDRFDWPSVDFVTDRTNLRKLLRWVEGRSDRDFRIDMQLAGERTVLLNFWLDRTKEMMPGNTFGYNFEKASTTVAPGCEGSETHHGIVTYNLNGLKMVVRFEVDACLPPETIASSTPTPHTNPETSIDDLTQTLGSTNLQSNTSSEAPDLLHGLTIVEGGERVTPDRLIELTTRSERSRTFHWKDAFPQLWFSQTLHHILAHHRQGEFVSMKQTDIAASAPEDEQPRLKKLRCALDVIKGIALQHGKEGRLSLVCIRGELKVYKRIDQRSCLPESALDLFD